MDTTYSTQQVRAHQHRANIILTLVGINLFAIFTAIGNRIDLLHPILIYLTLFTTAFCLYLYAASIVQNRTLAFDRTSLVIILAFSVLFRLVLIHGYPTLSTDIYRYIWDGRLTCHWINPYRWSPWDPRLAEYRDRIWQPMEYKAFATVYMPISQLFFAIGYILFRENLIGFKLIFTICDLGVVGILALLLKRMGKDPARVIWYAWCPLPICEVAMAGHQDVTGVLMLMAGLLCLFNRRLTWAAILLASAGLTKGFALLLIPLFLRYVGRQAQYATVLALLYLGLPLWVYLPQFVHGMGQYLTYVHVNSGLFCWVDQFLSYYTALHYQIASKLGNILLLGILIWSVRTRPQNHEDFLRRSIIVIGACLLTVPTLFPWYVIWIMPLVTLYGKRPSYALIGFTLLVNLVYTFYYARATESWVTYAEYVPLYIMLWLEYRAGYWRKSDLPGLDSIESLRGSSGGADAKASLPEPFEEISDASPSPRPLGLDAT